MLHITTHGAKKSFNICLEFLFNFILQEPCNCCSFPPPPLLEQHAVWLYELLQSTNKSDAPILRRVRLMLCYSLGDFANLRNRELQTREKRWISVFQNRQQYLLTSSYRQCAGQLSRYSDCLRAGRSGDRTVVGTRFSARPDRPWGPPSLLYNGYRVFAGDKVRPGRAADHSPPSSSAVMEE